MITGDNVVPNRTTLIGEPVTCLGAISKDRGLVNWMLKPRSIRQQDFCDFLSELRTRSGQVRLRIVLDNCRVHHSKLVKATADGLNIELIWNKPYSPQFNAMNYSGPSSSQSLRRLFSKLSSTQTSGSLSESS